MLFDIYHNPNRKINQNRPLKLRHHVSRKFNAYIDPNSKALLNTHMLFWYNFINHLVKMENILLMEYYNHTCVMVANILFVEKKLINCILND